MRPSRVPRSPGSSRPRALSGATVFHAGTALEGGRLVVAGGRVLNVSAVGADLAEARDLAYRAAALISFDGMQLRTDVGEPVHV